MPEERFSFYKYLNIKLNNRILPKKKHFLNHPKRCEELNIYNKHIVSSLLFISPPHLQFASCFLNTKLNTVLALNRVYLRKATNWWKTISSTWQQVHLLLVNTVNELVWYFFPGYFCSMFKILQWQHPLYFFPLPAHCHDNRTSWMGHSCLSHIFPSMWRAWLLSLLPFPLRSSKLGRCEKPHWLLAPGKFLFVCFTRSPYHNPNKMLQNSFIKTNQFPKDSLQTKKPSQNPERPNTPPTRQCMYLSIHTKETFFCSKYT